MIFDFHQNLKQVLGSATTGLEHGAVTCLDIHISNERLVCGHQHGFIVFWDLVKGKAIKIINADRNSKETAIACVQFLDSENEVVAVDDKVLSLSSSSFHFFHCFFVMLQQNPFVFFLEFRELLTTTLFKKWLWSMSLRANHFYLPRREARFAQCLFCLLGKLLIQLTISVWWPWALRQSSSFSA
jgi:hypothetical protein